MRTAYFVVTKQLGVEVPAIYWDELPRAPMRNLVYIVRLDELSNADKLVNAPLAQLFAIYLHLRRRGKLPPRWEPPTARRKPEPVNV